MEATPGIEIQGKRLPQSRLASNSQFITKLELPRFRPSLAFPLSVHGVVPNPYQVNLYLPMTFDYSNEFSALKPKLLQSTFGHVRAVST